MSRQEKKFVLMDGDYKTVGYLRLKDGLAQFAGKDDSDTWYRSCPFGWIYFEEEEITHTYKEWRDQFGEDILICKCGWWGNIDEQDVLGTECGCCPNCNNEGLTLLSEILKEIDRLRRVIYENRSCENCQYNGASSDTESEEWMYNCSSCRGDKGKWKLSDSIGIEKNENDT